MINGNEECCKCKAKICSEHSKSFTERMPCRCGSCNDVETNYYCLPCVTLHEPTDYNSDD